MLKFYELLDLRAHTPFWPPPHPPHHPNTTHPPPIPHSHPQSRNPHPHPLLCLQASLTKLLCVDIDESYFVRITYAIDRSFHDGGIGGENFNPTFKGFTLSDYRTLMCFGFRPSRANWIEMLNFLEAFDREECGWIECENYYTFGWCYDPYCPYAHPPPMDIRYSNQGCQK